MAQKLEKVVYGPRSSLLRLDLLILSMFKDLFRSKELAWRLFVRNISAAHRQSLFGYLWLFAAPVGHAAVWILLNSNDIVKAGDTGMPYPVYVLTGVVLWNGFKQATYGPLEIYNQSIPILSKINFPREALMLTSLALIFFDSIIRFAVLIPVYIYYGVEPTANLMYAPFAFFAVVMFGFVIGVLILPVGALFHDIPKAIDLCIQFLFFLTPIAYSPKAGTWIAELAAMNPVSPLIVTARELITGTEVTPLTDFFMVASVIPFLFFIGWVVYRLAMPHLIERMSA